VESRSRRGYADEVREAAVTYFVEGVKLREIARRLGVDPRTVANWVNDTVPYVHAKSAAERLDAVLKANPDPPCAAARPAHFAKRRATVVDVAELADVSVSTVSNYLNDKGRMSDHTRERIRAAMIELHYTPSSLTRALRQRRTQILGVVTFGLYDMDMGRNPAPSILVGIHSGAGSLDYNMLVYTARPHFGPSNASPLRFLDGHIDGLIWVGPFDKEPVLRTVAEAGLPTMVLLGRSVSDGVGFIAVDNVGGIVQVVEHLAGLGHERIGFISSVFGSDFLDRLEGYKKGLKAVGLPLDPAIVAANDAISRNWIETDTKDYEKTLDRWLALPKPPTAIILTSDSWAEWTANELRRRGLRVPDDVAVTGFNDIPMASIMAGGLTTVRQDCRYIGELGVERLVALINGEPVENCRIVVPASLVVRASTVRTDSTCVSVRP
jgi:DNA-binding LacI/PurR family transcriptional regulator